MSQSCIRRVFNTWHPSSGMPSFFLSFLLSFCSLLTLWLHPYKNTIEPDSRMEHRRWQERFGPSQSTPLSRTRRKIENILKGVLLQILKHPIQYYAIKIKKSFIKELVSVETSVDPNNVADLLDLYSSTKGWYNSLTYRMMTASIFNTHSICLYRCERSEKERHLSFSNLNGTISSLFVWSPKQQLIIFSPYISFAIGWTTCWPGVKRLVSALMCFSYGIHWEPTITSWSKSLKSLWDWASWQKQTFKLLSNLCSVGSLGSSTRWWRLS